MSALPLPSAIGILGLGTTELLIILFLVVLLFGARRLPDLAKGLGQSIKEFKKASSEADAAPDDDEETAEKRPKVKAAAKPTGSDKN